MKSLIFISLFAVAAQGHAASTFTCFSKYYSSNAVDIRISGQVVNDEQIKNLKVLAPDEGLNYNIKLAEAVTGYNPRIYRGYNKYLLGKNPVGGIGLRGINILLPNNISKLLGRFDAYVSDSNADNSGSSGYFRVLCQGR